jgi:2'-5' RNA ligase
MDGSVVTVGNADGGGTSGECGSSHDSSRATEFFALVSYLPRALSEFLSNLRHDLDPRFLGKPHLTILPPRPLQFPWNQAWAELRPAIEASPRFAVELGDVETFNASQVVYLALRKGQGAVETLHELLNAGCAGCGESWPYHPHVTLAHGSFGEKFGDAATDAQRRWNDYSGERGFTVDRLTWVKTTIVPGVNDRGTRSMVASDSAWVDLAESELSSHDD